MPNTQGYNEQTIFLPDYNTVIEIYGDDDYGWYGHKEELKEWSDATREWRKLEGVRNKDPEPDQPLPFRLRNSRNPLFAYIYRPDGSKVNLSWLVANGCFECTSDEDDNS